MDESRWQRLRDGVVGSFFPLSAERTDELTGMARLDDEHAYVVLAADKGHFDDDLLPHDCVAVAGRTELGEVLLLPVRRRGGTFAGAFPVVRYYSPCVLLDPDFDSMDGDKISSFRFGYRGLAAWTDDSISEELLEEDGRVVGVRAEVRASSRHSAELGDDFTVRLSTSWAAEGTFDRRTLSNTLHATVEAMSPRPIGEHLLRLDAIHALLALAHRTEPKASSAEARLTVEADWCPAWERNTVRFDASPDRQDFPHLGLDHIGGIEGLAAWIRLVLRHRRAVEPLVRPALFPNQTPESQLLSTAAAMEYWVATHARTASWAKKRQGEELPVALTRCVDDSWNEWIGDSGVWSRRFWATYRDLKHRPDAAPDPGEVQALELSGRWLLTAALLDDCAGSSLASWHLFSVGSSLGMAGHHIREILGLGGEPHPGDRQ